MNSTLATQSGNAFSTGLAGTARLVQTQCAVAVRPETARAVLEETLGVLEAAAYAGHAGGLHGQVGDGLIGGLAAIRTAHARTCVCASGSEGSR